MKCDLICELSCGCDMVRPIFCFFLNSFTAFSGSFCVYTYCVKCCILFELTVCKPNCPLGTLKVYSNLQLSAKSSLVSIVFNRKSDKGRVSGVLDVTVRVYVNFKCVRVYTSGHRYFTQVKPVQSPLCS